MMKSWEWKRPLILSPSLLPLLPLLPLLNAPSWSRATAVRLCFRSHPPHCLREVAPPVPGHRDRYWALRDCRRGTAKAPPPELQGLPKVFRPIAKTANSCQTECLSQPQPAPTPQPLTPRDDGDGEPAALDQSTLYFHHPGSALPPSRRQPP